MRKITSADVICTDVAPLFVHFSADNDITARLYARGYRLRPEFLSGVKSC